MKRIEEDFGGFFKMDVMLLHIALGFVLIPLKPDVLKLVFDVHKTKGRLPYYSPPLVKPFAANRVLGQWGAIGTNTIP